MAKTSSVFARVEPQVKEQAENILNQLGIPMSNAIALFLQQIIIQRGIPFKIQLPASEPLAFGSLSDDQFNEIMEKGVAEYAAGNITSAEEVRREMRKEYGV